MEEMAPIKNLLNEIHWYYASEILMAAQKVAQSERAYPVMVTSFRCTPDAFVMDYFKKIMEAHDKPYLILQLDEHASSVGYETRIEAAIRSFQNHHAARIEKKNSMGRQKKVPVYWGVKRRSPFTHRSLSRQKRSIFLTRRLLFQTGTISP